MDDQYSGETAHPPAASQASWTGQAPRPDRMMGANAALSLFTGLALVFSMAAILGLVVVHHKQKPTYDNDTCSGCSVLSAELARQAKALSGLWRFVEAVDDRGTGVQGTGLHDEDVRVGH